MTQAEILLVLLSWAQNLSGYPMQPVPEVLFRPHTFFVQRACYNKECQVLGWYNDEGIVYIDEIYRNLEDDFASSLIVHEFTHYLQDKSGYWGKMTCEKRISREREAYFVQNQYIERVLSFTMRIAPKKVWC